MASSFVKSSRVKYFSAASRAVEFCEVRYSLVFLKVTQSGGLFYLLKLLYKRLPCPDS